MAKLELIMPHWNEPWEVSRPFFEMLSFQRGIDFSELLVTVVQDGGDDGILPLFDYDFPYDVRQIIMPHKGVSAARNHGIDSAVGDWICFCDCDDAFTDIYSLKFVFDALDDERNDLLWTPFYIETYNKDGDLIIRDNSRFNRVWTHCKFIRRTWLKEHPAVRFVEEFHFSEDSAFNAVLGMEIDPEKVAMIRSPITVYTWTYRQGSATTDPVNKLRNMWGQFERNKYVAQEYRKRDLMSEYQGMIGRTVTDAYEQLNRIDPPDDLDGLKRAFTAYYRRVKLVFRTVEHDLLGRLMAASRKEAQDCGYFNPDKPEFYGWLDDLEEEYGADRNVD